MQAWSMRKWHRRLGMWLGWLMLAWFLSGAVIMYAHLPRQYRTPEGRSAELPSLKAAEIKIDFVQAWSATGRAGEPAASRLGRVAGRPAYFFLDDQRRRQVVWADTGQVLEEAGRELAARAAALAAPTGAALSYYGLVKVDQWTVGSGAAAGQAPFHKFCVDDDRSSVIHVSARTGEVCQVTNRDTRFWSWMGAIPHWLYFTALRRHRDLWRWGIIVLAGAGCLLCLSGLWLGVRRFRLRGWRNGRRSPFLGARRWHHYLGLAFGLPALAWTFSGMMSLHPFDWSTPAPSNAALNASLSRGGARPGLCLLHPSEALDALGRDFPVKTMNLIGFQGRPYYLALDGVGASRLVPARRNRPVVMETLPEAEIAAAAGGLLPGYRMVSAALLDRGGLYLPKWNQHVFRAQYDDPDHTWLYIDPARARIVRRLDDSGRLDRWLYNFLHCLDLPWLLRHGTLREVIMLLLLGGGALLCLTGPWSRLRRKKGNNRGA